MWVSIDIIFLIALMCHVSFHFILMGVLLLTVSGTSHTLRSVTGTVHVWCILIRDRPIISNRYACKDLNDGVSTVTKDDKWSYKSQKRDWPSILLGHSQSRYWECIWVYIVSFDNYLSIFRTPSLLQSEVMLFKGNRCHYAYLTAVIYY